MNKNNVKDFLPLVQALAEGKTIQLNDGSASSPEWRDLVDMSFSHPRILYRIKPEPREWRVMVYPTGEVYSLAKNEVCTAREVIRVREVIE